MLELNLHDTQILSLSERISCQGIHDSRLQSSTLISIHLQPSMHPFGDVVPRLNGICIERNCLLAPYCVRLQRSFTVLDIIMAFFSLFCEEVFSRPFFLGLLRTIYIYIYICIYIRCMYGIFGITKRTVIYGVYIRIWPTLLFFAFINELQASFPIS
jgi:hypothetical protein